MQGPRLGPVLESNGSIVGGDNETRKSCRWIASGGDDHAVRIWGIKQDHPHLVLQGVHAPVHSVAFDANESHVLGGSAEGSINIWDMQEGKGQGTVSGHREECLALDFHPFGEFFASGGADHALKLWDLRQKSCIHKYGGHTGAVSSLRFSPDGRLLASGSQKGVVKVLDLTAGKLLKTFCCGDGTISGIEYHPTELLMAGSSMDGTVTFWDLDTFETLGDAASIPTGVQSIAFAANGTSLYAATQDLLTTWMWEPTREVSECAHNCQLVGDMTPATGRGQEQRLLIADISTEGLSMWLAELGELGKGSSRVSGVVTHVLASASSLSSTDTSTPIGASIDTATSKPALKDRGIGGVGAVQRHSLADPPLLSSASPGASRRMNLAAHASYTPSFDGVTEHESTSAPRPTDAADPGDAVTTKPLATPSAPWRRLGNLGARARLRSGKKPPEARADVMPNVRSLSVSSDEHSKSIRTLRHSGEGKLHSDAKSEEKTENEVGMPQMLMKGHKSTMETLSARHCHLLVISGFWQRSDMRGTLSALERCGDLAVCRDVFSSIMEHSQISLVQSPAAVAILLQMLSSEDATHVRVAIEMALALVHKYSQVITDTLKSTISGARDLSFENRVDACKAARNALVSIIPYLAPLTSMATPSELAAQAEQLKEELQTL